MKVLYTSLAVGLCLLYFSSELSAQEYITYATYDTQLPLGDTKTFSGSDMSFRGFSIGGRRFIEKDLSVGLHFGWNVFYNRTNELISIYNGAVYGVQDRYINSIPIMLSTHYYLGKRREVRPYVGLMAGTLVFMQRFDIGIYMLEKTSWRFNVMPEAGVLIPVDRDVNFMLSAKYNYAFAGGTISGVSWPHSYLQFSAGFTWTN